MTEWFQLGKFLGVLFLFAGFLVSIEVFREIRVPFTSIRLGSDPARAGRRGGSCAAAAEAAGERPRPRSDAPGLTGAGPTMAPMPPRAPTAAPHACPGRPVVADRPPVAGFAIVIVAASLFGTLGPLSRFAYDAGMEPTAVRRLARRDRAASRRRSSSPGGSRRGRSG